MEQDEEGNGTGGKKSRRRTVFESLSVTSSPPHRRARPKTDCNSMEELSFSFPFFRKKFCKQHCPGEHFLWVVIINDTFALPFKPDCQSWIERTFLLAVSIYLVITPPKAHHHQLSDGQRNDASWEKVEC